MNTEKLTGKIIVITGAGSGMGAAMAKDFASREAKVALFDLNEETGKKVQQEIVENGGCAAYYKVDVTKKAEIEEAADDVEETLGKITSWVNSAGVSRMKPFLECSEELWDLTLDVNLKATFLCCQVAVTKMLSNGGGSIVNMSSLSGKKASSWQTIYCASKFGVQGLSQSIAKEFADQNIRVNTICPGIVHTEMWDRLKYEYAKKRNLDPEEVLPYFEKNIPMHRLVDLQDVIQAAIFLLTDCSSYLTGQSVNLVGGEWMD
ncbi:MAG TPA: SDR family oxidoreductase [Candidatus Anaerostipes excrementavium]|uniref:SDR family oxidoreductase n=1 Tax=Candidatus Anaerostipes excrementavium TaxID=2838463 RepID=A0A9D1WVK4_9FIRM|nr:SDR family oxidoreductase [uncultured Anaerostipes sp.]HIX66845.1 SDR family oxidoreductase [Candidatus Anaerostipes excrementavium]